MSESNMKIMQKNSYLSGGNAEYLETLYENFLKNPQAVEPQWRQYFETLPLVNGAKLEVSHSDIQNNLLQQAKLPKTQLVGGSDVAIEHKQNEVNKLIAAYRTHGHLAAQIDPLGVQRSSAHILELSHYNLSNSDFDKTFATQGLLSKPTATLKEIYQALNEIYCSSIGAEYMYINNQEEVAWLQQRLEQKRPTDSFSTEQKRTILQGLVAADGLERFLGTKYVGQKRFSLEGGDSLIPMLQEMIQRAGIEGVKEVVIGMAHRGRLNVLVNIMGMSSEELFAEFEGKKDYGLTSGDVKYHLGYSSNVDTPAGKTHLSLAYNPSHLEIIGAMVMGSVRARQDRRQAATRKEVMPVIIHGDAAVSGQGVVMETVNMSQTRAYGVGGSIRIVVNNQVGFTTSHPEDARSSKYCTDIAKMIEVPAFHVNTNDPEAVVFIAQLAVDYRNRFGKDVFIDLVCYRRHGHNEADEPAATQPLMYQKIKMQLPTHELYAKKLIAENICTEAETQAMVQKYRDDLDCGRQMINAEAGGSTDKNPISWALHINQSWAQTIDTGFKKAALVNLANKMLTLPADFQLQRQVGTLMETRRKMAKGEIPCDWGFAENLAYATLLAEGHCVRMSGQDCGRGTFAHRHAVLHEQRTAVAYIPLQHLDAKQADFQIYDSLLSEVGVLGFEYGYAGSMPSSLVLWEAQYGDFANGAQVVFDQFISSAWQKWQRLNGLVMLLPHGYEGAGPEHTSARLERFLQLCAENNMQVCNLTTPAQIFHVLRRQVLRPFRAPLVIMSPKSILRNKLAVSSLDELANGKFELVISEIDSIKAADVKRVILCSGKVYYDLLTKRRENNQKDVAIIRLEQLYPFPHDELKAELAKYTNVKDVVWCQEEPKNQGAWFMNYELMLACLYKGQNLSYIGRPASASPAAGYGALHRKQQDALVEQALKV